MAKAPKTPKIKAKEESKAPELDVDSFPQLPPDFEAPYEYNQENELRIRSLCESDSWGFVPPEPVRDNITNVARFLVQEPELFRMQKNAYSTNVDLLTDEFGLISVHPQPEESTVLQQMSDLYAVCTASTAALSSREMRVMLKTRARELFRVLREDPILVVALQEYVHASYFGIESADGGRTNNFTRRQIHEELGLKPVASALDVAIIDLLSHGKDLFAISTPVEFYTPAANAGDLLRRTQSALAGSFTTSYGANYPLDSHHYNGSGPVNQLFCEETSVAFNSAFYLGAVVKDCIPWRLETEIINGSIMPRSFGKQGNAFLTDSNMDRSLQFLMRDFSDTALEFASTGEGLGKMLSAQLRYIICRCDLRNTRLRALVENLKLLNRVGVDVDGIATYVPKHHYQSEMTNITERNRAY